MRRVKIFGGIAALALSTLVLLLGGCGGSNQSTTTEAPSARDIASKRPPEVAHAADWGELKKFAGSRAKKLLIPSGPEPKQVVIRDLKLGGGKVIKPNQNFTFNYVSFTYYNGKLFERVWPTQETLPWNIKKTVNAWWPGLKGMREGGIRELISPSFWAYQNGALVYIVKLIKVEPA